MRILVLCYEFPPIGGGGGRVASDLCRYFVKHGHSVIAQTTRLKGLPECELKDGYTIYRTFAFRKHLDRCTVLEMFFYIVTNTLPALRHAFFWKPDIVHCHFAVPTGVVAWLVSKICCIPYVITAHLGDVPGGVPHQTNTLFKLLKPFTVPIWKNAVARTAVSDYVTDLAVTSYGFPVQTIANGIELHPNVVCNTIPHDPVKLIFTGRFNPQKNLLFLIATLAYLKDFQWTLDLVGDGNLMEQVKGAVSDNNLTSRIRFHGWLPPDKADEIMSNCDVLVLPSLYEGMPVVGVKALLFGLAIVASNIKGLNGLVVDGSNGYSLPVNDTNRFQQAIRSVITDKNKLQAMRLKSSQLVTNFDLSAIATLYETVFQKAIL